MPFCTNCEEEIDEGNECTGCDCCSECCYCDSGEYTDLEWDDEENT